MIDFEGSESITIVFKVLHQEQKQTTLFVSKHLNNSKGEYNSLFKENHHH